MSTIRCISISILLALLGACASLPPAPASTPSHAPADTADTRLGRAARTHRPALPSVSNFTPLARGSDALSARLGLIEHAERSLDLQYYIWHRDKSGMRLAQQLKSAAARGVRVRLLLDDIGTSLPDEHLLALDAVPNVEVRLFNPVAWRFTRTLGALLDFSRINRRMHNKTMLADNQVVILGGRNIGDEYFAARGAADFGDLDVLALGPVVQAASVAFDRYWNSAQVWPILALTDTDDSHTEASATTRETLPENSTDDAELIRSLLGSKANFFEASATLLVDDPSKITRSPEDTNGHLWPQLLPVITATQQELLLISPYFVPGKPGMDFLRELRSRGVAITVLTNSLAATDVSAVHAGYSRYRKELLEAGIALWEVKPGSAPDTAAAASERETRSQPLIGDSLRSSLHAKTFIFDKRELFIGSLNLDPRSTALNTETGVLIPNADFAERMSRNIRKLLPASAYRLSLHEGQVRWHEELPDSGTRDFDHDPKSSALRRIWVNLLGLLPIEEQL
ncbi:phospholipase D family protein [Uliginosibacterium flavum]|uniref:Phospholipase D family protein n=1 Tax=Uliginosibacterium flavum TaxID=1396831 RepID=A0ABV2THF0_9RHOO